MAFHMSSRGWEAGGAGWRWRRRLWVWEEEMLGECITLLHSVSLQFNVIDTWRWQPEPSAGSYIDQLLDKVKHCSLWWLKASNAIFVYGYTSWWSNP
ncbi:hypothetical protein MTR_8g012905 [Medicago truncatula]|uniref:Uncharacterized protein n=1 Tax=Medicago truncatula TaxID=3880 RepID=A0A072TMU5_MEDTR|nr:hypothetical protein MTR_8g012905 [Medicago truncatula]